MSPRRIGGFTLVELMVTVVVLAILSAIAYPSFQGVIRSNRVVTTSNELLASLALARSEAIKGIGAAGVCSSLDGATCATGTDWSGGWLVWREDRDASGVSRIAVRYRQGSSKVTVTGPADELEFTVQGRLDATTRTFQVEPSDATEPARCILVNVTGQHRIIKGACA
ncbi:GspH/FimT family pseudopilin [[Pseudomonas] boreopolis]|uniref:GspH/FimT family pseudopilin n=1 Tax=Xanthomonas boreopolis TaxID=86183 RepID=UPI003D9B35A2